MNFEDSGFGMEKLTYFEDCMKLLPYNLTYLDLKMPYCLD